MIYLKLFYTFFKIGLFGFGGGYGMLSLIQNEVVEKSEWITVQQFTDIVAISQMTPGPIGINSATYVGYESLINAGAGTTGAVLGSLVASFSVMLPSFIIMLLITTCLMKYKDHQAVKFVLSSLRFVVVGLLLAAVLSLLSVENFGVPGTDTLQFAVSIILFLASLVATWKFKVNPIRVIIIAGLFGGVFYTLL